MTIRVVVAVAQMSVLIGYLYFFLTGDALSPEESLGFTTGEWLFLLVPPALFAVAVLAGFVLLAKASSPRRWDYIILACCSALALLAMAGTLLLVPLSIFGEMMDV